jgi:hypothetical protein
VFPAEPPLDYDESIAVGNEHHALPSRFLDKCDVRPRGRNFA